MNSKDLRREQEATLARPPYAYSAPAKFFFFAMAMLAGKKDTLSKILLIELLASIPYRSWELKMYARTTLGYQNREVVKKALAMMDWSRHAQDNEFWHVQAAEAKIRESGTKKAWYLTPPIPRLVIGTYVIFTRTLAFFNMRRAFLFNAEFEDHAEHIYADFVKDHPEWEKESVSSPEILERMPFESWADVFRLIGLDERNHRNESFAQAGLAEEVIHYEGEEDHQMTVSFI